MRPDALLFDLDGTLILTDDLHAEVFAEIGARFGVPVDRERYDREIQGRLNADIFGDLLPGEDSATLADEKERMFRERLGAKAAPVQGLVALLDWAVARGVPTAVVTNAPRENAQAMLRAIGLAERFGALVLGDELPRGKPDPLPYRIAMARLGAEPGACLAFEDSRSGVASARAAGARVYGLASSLDAATLRAAGAHDVIADFADPGLWARLDPERLRP